MARPKPPKPEGIEKLAMNAGNLLNNPAFRAALDAVKGAYTEAMIATAPTETDEREHFHKCIHSLVDIETALTAFLQAGKVEKSMLIKQEKAKK